MVRSDASSAAQRFGDYHMRMISSYRGLELLPEFKDVLDGETSETPFTHNAFELDLENFFVRKLHGRDRLVRPVFY